MSFRLVIDPVACDGRGLCAELVPERIALDDWGYPIVDAAACEGAVLRHAKRAVRECPMAALRLERL